MKQMVLLRLQKDNKSKAAEAIQRGVFKTFILHLFSILIPLTSAA
jgi:hypothetical protein